MTTPAISAADLAEARELVAAAPTDAMRVARNAHEHSEAWARHIAAALAERERKVWAAIKGMAECGGFGMDNNGVVYRAAHPHRTSAEALCAILKAAWEATKL
jgi:hypothetical protein